MSEIDTRPIAYDICCGLGGWTEALLDEGYRVIGFDIEAHDYGTGGYPGELCLRDITTIHGSELKDAALIVCSPPCQRYSYMAMPWSRAKAQAAMIEADTTGEELRKLNLLFDACFRMQREASEAAGHHIPMIVENVRGAQKWVGRAAYHYGSFYLWGDVPALMPIVSKAKKFNPDGTNHPSGSWFAIADSKDRGAHTKAVGKNWNEWKDWDGTEENKPASVRPWGDEIETPGRSLGKGSANKFGTHNMGSGDKMMAELGVKADGSGWTEKGSLASHNRLVSNQGLKLGITIGGSYAERKARGDMTITTSSNSRKAASAMIAKIPYPLAQHIARTFKPR